MEQAACPSCGYIKKPGEFGAVGECSKCGASLLLKAKKTPDTILKKRAEERVTRSGKQQQLKELNKLIWVNLILWPIVLVITLMVSGGDKEIDEEHVIDESKNTAESEEITRYMKRSFGMVGYTASWYYDIILIDIEQIKDRRHIRVSTLLESHKKTAALNICGAVSNYWNDHRDDIHSITVYDTAGDSIARRSSLDNYCY